MAISKEKKVQILTTLEEEFKTSGSVAFVAYRGVSVADITGLRRSLREKGVSFVIAKKTLIKLAAKNAGMKEIPVESLEGPVAVAFSHEDELAGPQLIHKFSKEHAEVDLLGGIFDNDLLEKKQIQVLAQLPDRKALIGQVVGLFAAPLRGVAGVGSALVSGFVRALSEAQKKKATEA